MVRKGWTHCVVVNQIELLDTKSGPVEPAIRALLTDRPDFDRLAVDVIGRGNTFRSLLSACRVSDERTFAFGVERVGTTIFLVRQANPWKSLRMFRGYGH